MENNAEKIYISDLNRLNSKLLSMIAKADRVERLKPIRDLVEALMQELNTLNNTFRAQCLVIFAKTLAMIQEIKCDKNGNVSNPFLKG